MIDLLHGHTFAVELAARLLANGLMKPEMLLTKLEKEKAALDAEEKIGTTKDGRSRKATYYDHIHSLFSFCKLSKAEQGILRSLTLMPAKGIPTWQFGEWMDLRNLNTVIDLIEMGLIQPQNDREILLHPMIREVAVEELKPSVQNCKTLLKCIQQVCLRHGEDISYHKQLSQVIENVMELAENDDGVFYLRFLEDAFQCMLQYRSDYAAVQESIGANYLTQGLLVEARVHFEKALHIYEKLYAAEPERIEEKKQAIIATYARAGVSIAQQILAARDQESFVEIG